MSKIKEKMLEMKKELLERIRANTEDQQNNHASSIEDVDFIQEKAENEFINQLIERDNLKVHQIDRALSLIDLGKYGECQSCGCKISEKRLLAVPLTQFCIDCQE